MLGGCPVSDVRQLERAEADDESQKSLKVIEMARRHREREWREEEERECYWGKRGLGNEERPQIKRGGYPHVRPEHWTLHLSSPSHHSFTHPSHPSPSSSHGFPLHQKPASDHTSLSPPWKPCASLGIPVWRTALHERLGSDARSVSMCSSHGANSRRVWGMMIDPVLKPSSTHLRFGYLRQLKRTRQIPCKGFDSMKQY